jgi:hypothetical protein
MAVLNALHGELPLATGMNGTRLGSIAGPGEGKDVPSFVVSLWQVAAECAVLHAILAAM